MEWSEIERFRPVSVGPYERQMGESIAGLLRLFSAHVPDHESHGLVLRLATTPSRWSAGHALFDLVRGRLIYATGVADRARRAQYGFEELCLKAMYNAAEPMDPFDSCSPFFVAGAALSLARVVGVPLQGVAAVLSPLNEWQA